MHSDDPTTPDAFVWVGGLAINDSVGGEPSLQWIIDAYGLAANDGDPTPATYPLGATSLPPSDGILVRGFTVRDSSAPVKVTVLAAFAGPPGRERILSWGWTPQDTSPGAPVASFTHATGLHRDDVLDHAPRSLRDLGEGGGDYSSARTSTAPRVPGSSRSRWPASPAPTSLRTTRLAGSRTTGTTSRC